MQMAPSAAKRSSEPARSSTVNAPSVAVARGLRTRGRLKSHPATAQVPMGMPTKRAMP